MAHLTRHYMYRRIEENLSKQGSLPLSGRILGISGVGHFRSHIDEGNSQIREAQFPEVDMQHLPYGDGVFDYVICDQVVEHLEDPFMAVKEAGRVLKQGGTLILTTCFMNAIHPSPADYWRYSPDALRYLCRDFAEVTECGGWGNRIAIMLCMLGDRFRFRRVTESRWSVFNMVANLNESAYPIVTWIVARK